MGWGPKLEVVFSAPTSSPGLVVRLSQFPVHKPLTPRPEALDLVLQYEPSLKIS